MNGTTTMTTMNDLVDYCDRDGQDDWYDQDDQGDWYDWDYQDDWDDLDDLQ